jgi:hypothetical protein
MLHLESSVDKLLSDPVSHVFAMFDADAVVCNRDINLYDFFDGL